MKRFTVRVTFETMDEETGVWTVENVHTIRNQKPSRMLAVEEALLQKTMERFQESKASLLALEAAEASAAASAAASTAPTSTVTVG